MDLAEQCQLMAATPDAGSILTCSTRGFPELSIPETLKLNGLSNLHRVQEIRAIA